LLQSVNADDLTPATPMLQSQQLEHEFQRIGLVADESFTALLPFATVAEALSWLQTIPDGAGPSGLAEDLYLRFQARLASIRDRKV